MPKLVARAELARLAGVSAAAITKACKGSLSAACEGKRIDLEHEAVRRYLEGKGVQSGEVSSSTPAPQATTAPASTVPAQRYATSMDDLDRSDIEGMDDMTLRELTDRFGTVTAFKDWLDARKKLSDIREKDLKNAEAEGTLIARALVEHHVFGAIENANRQLLADSPKTITRRLYAMAGSGAPLEEAERVVRDIISSQLRPVKATAARVLRNA